MHFSCVCLKIKQMWFLAGVPGKYILFMKMQQCSKSYLKVKTENLSGIQGVQRREEKQKCFRAFACAHQSKRQESLWTSRTADKNNLRIHQTTCISSTDNRMDRCQTVKNSCILTLGRSYYISIRVSRLFVYSSGKFFAVRWSAWKPKVMASTFLIPQKWKHTWIGLQSILCGPESQIIQTLPVDHNTFSMKRFHTFLAALKAHKRLTVAYTHTESWIQSAHTIKAAGL